MVEPSIITPPNWLVEAVGKVYCAALITPLVIVIVLPSGITPPRVPVIYVPATATGK